MNDRGAHAAHALDLGLHGRGYPRTGEYLRIDGGRGGALSHYLGRGMGLARKTSKASRSRLEGIPGLAT
jgi:hypothetical protein